MQFISKEITESLLLFAIEQTDFVIKTTENVRSYNDFLTSMEGIILFNSTCMCLQTIGETIRKVDDKTNGRLFAKYKTTPWKRVIGMRNIISHDYMSIDPEVIFETVKKRILPLKQDLERIVDDLRAGTHDDIFSRI